MSQKEPTVPDPKKLTRLEKYQLALLLFDAGQEPKKIKRRKGWQRVFESQGFGQREIAKRLGEPESTIDYWVHFRKIKVGPYEKKNVTPLFEGIKREHTQKYLGFLVAEKMMDTFWKKSSKKPNTIIAEAAGVTVHRLRTRQVLRKTPIRGFVVQSMVDKEYEKRLPALKKAHTESVMHYLLVDRFARGQDIGESQLTLLLEAVGVETDLPAISSMMHRGKRGKNGMVYTKKPWWFHKDLVDNNLVDEYAGKIEGHIGRSELEYFLVMHFTKDIMHTGPELKAFLTRCPHTNPVPESTLRDWKRGDHKPKLAIHFSELEGVKSVVNKIAMRLNLEDALNHRSWIWPRYRKEPNFDFLYGAILPKFREVFSKEEVKKVMQDSPMFEQGRNNRWYSRLKPMAVKKMDKQEYKEVQNQLRKTVYKHRRKYRV